MTDAGECSHEVKPYNSTSGYFPPVVMKAKDVSLFSHGSIAVYLPKPGHEVHILKFNTYAILRIDKQSPSRYSEALVLPYS